MKRAAVLSVVFGFLFLTSCAGVPKHAPGLSDAKSRALRRDILNSLAKREASLWGMRGLASVRYGSKLFGVKGETAFALRRPDDLRVDALSDFGAFASQVILSKGRLQILWPSDGRYFLGPADRGAMERFLLIGLEPRDVVDLFLGIVPLEREEHYRVAKTDGNETLLRGEKGELAVGRIGDRFVLRRYAEWEERGGIRYEVRYEGFQDNDGGLVAASLKAEFRDPKSRIEIRFKEIELNPKLGQNVFQQKIPQNAKPLDN